VKDVIAIGKITDPISVLERAQTNDTNITNLGFLDHRFGCGRTHALALDFALNFVVAVSAAAAATTLVCDCPCDQIGCALNLESAVASAVAVIDDRIITIGTVVITVVNAVAIIVTGEDDCRLLNVLNVDDSGSTGRISAVRFEFHGSGPIQRLALGINSGAEDELREPVLPVEFPKGIVSCLFETVGIVAIWIGIRIPGMLFVAFFVIVAIVVAFVIVPPRGKDSEPSRNAVAEGHGSLIPLAPNLPPEVDVPPIPSVLPFRGLHPKHPLHQHRVVGVSKVKKGTRERMVAAEATDPEAAPEAATGPTQLDHPVVNGVPAGFEEDEGYCEQEIPAPQNRPRVPNDDRFAVHEIALRDPAVVIEVDFGAVLCFERTEPRLDAFLVA
jgi:hypothetical protein